MKAHNVPGRVILLGTPAEEKDGGKIVMINNGGYKDMDVCQVMEKYKVLLS